uniref:Complement C5 n=1 Tax=Kryptolebias marmoratus TaxID=37003 RepID=A0A3Q3BGX5_KRYMA
EKIKLLLCCGEMRVCAQYLITAPLSLHLDAMETVFLQLFGFTSEVSVYVFLKTSMAPDQKILSQDVVRLNSLNSFQGVANVRVGSDVDHVVLHVQSDQINQHLSVPVSRTNGFLFIQTDKPLYTPHQKGENPTPSSYSDDFTTKAKTDFEVKEYVLPSFSILMEPQTNFISYQQFQDFSFKISARYLHGAPVAAGEAFLRYGYVSGTNAPTIIPSSLSEKGEVDVSLNMQEVLKKHDGPKDLNGLVGSYLYVAVLLQEDTGGITQEAEFAVVKFVRSPYSLSLISTPPFIKPGLPYNIKVCRGLWGDRFVLWSQIFSSLPAPSQASLSLEPVAYHSPNQRYLYIDTPMFDHSLSVGKYANIHVYSATPSYLHIKSLNYLVLSKGKVVFYRSVDFISSTDGKQTLNFLVTASMVPSIRLLVYYVLPGEGAIELVADSVWMDVKDNCVNGLVSFQQQRYKPKGNIALDIRTNQDGLVALSAVDSALFTLRPNFRDPVSMVLRHIEQSDQGCGGGGGKNNADVFRLAGLTFMTNANAHSLPKLGADFDLAPSLVRSYFPESWLWEVQRTRSNRLSVRKSLPDSLTTWQIKAIGMFQTGMCVAEPVDVSVSLPLSVDVPLPYQVVRGEQLELQGSVYNQEIDHITSTPCVWSQLSPGAVAPVSFTLLGLEPGEHMLTFTLKTQSGPVDIVKKTLRVVVRLDKMTVVLKNSLPQNIVPGSVVERLLTIHVEVVTVILKPEALKELINLPSGSAAAELERLLPLIQVYRYLETTGSWNLLGTDVDKLSSQVAISSFRKGDSSYSMWIGSESSTMCVNLLKTKPRVLISTSLSESVGWLIHRTQQPDGSFSEKSSFKHNKLMVGDGADKVEQSVFVTSFVLIALRRATSIRDPMLQLQVRTFILLPSAETYISRHALNVKSVYVRAVATYALTLHDPNSRAVVGMNSNPVCTCPGNPVELRYWQEASVSADWLKPDESSGLTVETTAYVLLTVLLKGRIQYANPILTWLSQDQHYGEGFYSIKDTVLTLEALTDYMRIIPRTVLSQDINIRYNRKGALGQVQLSRSRPVATPIQITKSDDITVSTGYGRGVSSLKTVFYQTMASVQPRCNFDLTIEVVGPDDSNDPSRHLVACIKYKPPPNELSESTLTVMKIQLPTGVEPQMEDLRPFRDGEDPVVSHYELQGSTVIIQMDSVPSDIFLCVGFRVRTRFRVIGVNLQLVCLPGSLCVKQFSDQEQKLQRLCVGEQCQCMTAACASYRGTIDSTLTADKRTEETCKPNIKYAYKVTVKSSAAEGDFMTYTATVDEVLKNSEVRTEVELVKKATCSGVDLQNNKQYLVMGSQGYRIPLDSEALVELWQTDCSSPECEDYIFQLKNFALDLQLLGCM